MAEETLTSPPPRHAERAAALAGRMPPHSIEAEEYLLSCCLLDGADVISRCLEARIRPESF
jgi:replicative DNA helicase